jgi:hypothetical protein
MKLLTLIWLLSEDWGGQVMQTSRTEGDPRKTRTQNQEDDGNSLKNLGQVETWVFWKLSWEFSS